MIVLGFVYDQLGLYTMDAVMRLVSDKNQKQDKNETKRAQSL
jgi:hypothetical protein